MMNKQNDWLVASLNNPDFTVSDFKNISDLSLDNTQFLNKELYKSSNFIRNQKQFQDENGNFSEKKFDKFYEDAASSFKDFSIEDTVDDYQYSMWDPSRPKNGKIKSINFNIATVKNPDHFKIGIEGINVTTLSDKTKRELAQNSKIFDPSTGQFLDHSVNDISLFSNPISYIKSLFDDPLVYATYDKDTVEIDPITGNKIIHKAGEWKVNEDGEYYTEKLNGRNLRGKQVVSTEDYITSENSALNSIDFFDSDDKEKSVTGVIAKNVAAVLPMFVPYVGTASKVGSLLKTIPTIYSGLLVGRELAKTLPMAYGMLSSLSGDPNPQDSKLANTLAAYGQKFSGSTSDYAQEHTFAFENIGSLMSDVALQWGQQKFIADTFNKLSKGGETAIKVAQDKASGEYMEQANKYIQQYMKGDLSSGKLATYIGLDKASNPLELVTSGKWAESAVGKAALNKYMPAAQRIFENRNKLAQDLSLVYMAMISNTDVYDSILEHGGTAQEAAAMAFGSTLGMFGVDKYLGLGEMFFEKDPARQAFKKMARENAELYMSGKKAITATEMDTKTGIVNKIKHGIDLGKKITNDFLGKYKDGTIGIVGKAIGEGAEEVSEELVTDFTKSLGELAGKFGYASQTDYGAWEDAANRYAMSFLGGAAGGAMFGGVEAWNNRNKNFQEFQNDLTTLIRQGKKDEILKEFASLRDKGQLGDTNLSYDTVTNSDGLETALTAGDDHISQAESNYRGLSNIVNQLDAILNSNDLKLDDDEVFDKMVQGEYKTKALSDFLKGYNIADVKEASFISKYQEDFNKLTEEIIQTEQAIQQLNAETTDPKKRTESTYQEKLQKLQNRKQELLEQKEYLFGEGSLGYVEKTLFAIDPKISSNFISLNIHQYARELTGKTFSELTKTEQEAIQKKYEEYSKDLPTNVDEAFQLYKNMENQLTPELEQLSKNKLDSEFKELERIRNEITKLKLLNVNDQVPTESDEDFASLNQKNENETDEQFNARIKAHEQAVHEYNIQESTKWIQEFTKKPITSTDFRFLKSQVGITKHELLKYFLDNIATEVDGVKKHWWELISDDEINSKHLEAQNKDLYDLVLKMGVDNEAALRDAIRTRIKKTAKSVISDKYNVHLLNTIGENEIFNTLKNSQTLQYYDLNATPDADGNYPLKVITTDDKIRYGIPIDYEFNSNKLTYKDFAVYLKLNTLLNGGTPGDVFNISDWNLLEESDKNKLSDFQKFYTEALINPEIFNSEIADQVIDIANSAKDVEEAALSEKISDTYFEQFDKFIKGFNDNAHVKQLNAITASTFVNNPVIPLLNKISSFRSETPINIEELLKNIYEIYESKESDKDFQLSEPQVQQLEQILKDMQVAKSFILGASVKTTDNQPIGHNKAINDFIKHHSDVFKSAEELIEIDSNDANIYLNEIDTYEKEIKSWLNKHKLNSGTREIKFIKADEALTKTIIQFFKLNREGFKIGHTDLLDGYEDLTIEDNLSSVVALQQLLYKNFINSGLKVEDVLEKLSPSTLVPEQIISQKTAKLDEDLSYDKFTQYDKFQLIVSSLAVDPVKFYKQLKSFLEGNESIAPITIQEYVGKLSYAQKENSELISNALRWLKSKSKSKLDIVENTTTITGLGGSGKTFAAIRLNLGKGENTWVCGPTNNQIDNLKKSLSSSTEKSKKDLMDLVLGTPNPKLSDLYNIEKLGENPFPIIKDSIKFTTIDNAPKYIVIDEATHFSAPELLLISKWCKQNSIKLFLLGDGHQRGIQLKDGVGNIENNSILTWRTPDLYISLRNGNQVKVKNQEPLLQIIDKINSDTVDALGDTLYADLFKKLDLQYYNQDTFSGELVTDTLSDEILAKIPKTIKTDTGERNTKIGYIGVADEVYDKLKNTGYDVSEALTPEQVQGQEFDYVVVNKDWRLELTPDNWRNNNIRIRNFTKDLYTIITRSTEGTVIIDNGLSNLIHCSETRFNGKYSSLESSTKKFREKHLPEIDKAIADNPEVTIASKKSTSTSDSAGDNTNNSTSSNNSSTENNGASNKDTTSNKDISLGDTSFKKEDLETETEPQKEAKNNEELNIAEGDNNDFSVYPENPITCYSSVSFSGINTAEDVWVNDNNSTEDLGIFVPSGEKVEKGSKIDAMTKVLQLKCVFQYGYSDWSNVPIAIREKFSKDSIENAKFFIKVETPSNSNRLIGLTKGLGLTNEERAYKGKIIKLIAKIQGKDGVEYSISLGGLNKPSTWEENKDFLKSIIKNKINEGKGDIAALQKQYDSYNDSVSKYKNLVDSWISKDQEIELVNPPKFGKYTRLEKLSGIYRLEDSVTSVSPYKENAPLQVQSQVHIITDQPGLKPELVGKPVMYVSSNLLLEPGQLEDLYIQQLKDPTLPKQVRIIALANVGVSFESLYNKNWSILYNITEGKRKFTTPMRLLPFGFRMYKAMWNYRADLNRFIERYTAWTKANNFEDYDVEELCKRDNEAFEQVKTNLGVDTLTEEEYRTKVDPEKAKELKVLWDFNDGLASYVKEFRLGYNSKHGAYLRKLTNIDTKFYETPDKAVGIYINPQLAFTQQTLLNNIFENVLDNFIPSFGDNAKSYISIDTNSLNEEGGSQKFNDWVKKLQSTNSINLEFQDDIENTKTKLTLSSDEIQNKLRSLPIVMMKLAHYMNIAMNRDIEDFKQQIQEALDDDANYYTLKIDDKPLDWIKFIDDLNDHISPSPVGDFKSTVPGIVPYKEVKDPSTGKVIQQIGRIDSRIRDMWNLMFHGVISTEVENDFTRDFIRASAAEFKYGIFSDPILCEMTKEEKGFSDITSTSNKFFGTNLATSGPLIQIDFKFKEAEKKETHTKQDLSFEDAVKPTEQEEYHNNIAPILTLNGIDIDPNDYDNLNEYKEKVNELIFDHIKDYLNSNNDENFNNIITGVDENGVIYLKNRPEFKGAEFVSKGDGSSAFPANQVLMSDGNLYYINISRTGDIIIEPVEEEPIKESNGGLVSPVDLVKDANEIISSIGFNEDIIDLFNINEVFPDTWSDGTVFTEDNYLDKDTYSKYIGMIGNKIGEIVDSGIEELAEVQGVSEDEFKQLIDETYEKLKSLQKTCFI